MPAYKSVSSTGLTSDHPSRKKVIVVTVVAMSIALLIWLPAIFTPFWGDDYFFLQNAKEARLAGDSWIEPFISDSNTAFWRPLSMDLPWRFIEHTLGGSPIPAHLFSFVCWLLSILMVAFLAYQIAMARQWQTAGTIALLAGFFYGFHGIHILVLHWVSAINSAILVAFVAATLTFWIKAHQASGIRQKIMALLTLVFLWCALFSKEVAITTPALMLLVSLLTYGFGYPGRLMVVTYTASVLSCAAWLYLFHKFTPIRYSAYEILLGEHLFKNLVALVGWLLNVPREALRLLVIGEIFSGLLWILACVAPMLVCLVLASGKMPRHLRPMDFFIVVIFCVISYGPYFLLKEQSYEYYAAIVLILPAILLARGMVESRYIVAGVACFTLSGAILMVGNRVLDYPSVIGRAVWAERQFEYLEEHKTMLSSSDSLMVQWKNYHQFAAIEVSGLAWRLEIPRDKIILVDRCPSSGAQVWIQGADGDFRFQTCP